MPNHKSVWKRLRQDKKRRVRRVSEMSRLRSGIKKIRTACDSENTEQAQSEIPKVFSLIDKASKRRLIHPRTADRKKSRLQRLINRLES